MSSTPIKRGALGAVATLVLLGVASLVASLLDVSYPATILVIAFVVGVTAGTVGVHRSYRT